ncbi:lamin tail domain-containing protein [Patescibacteria group bacterium]
MSAQVFFQQALIYLVLLISFSRKIYAGDIVINEFLPDLPSETDEEIEEWVELYNQGSSQISLNGWALKDSYDTHVLVIENITIEPNQFLVIKRNKSKFSLNNSSDQVRLFTSTTSAEPIDSFSYDKAYENKSWGRVPDGSGVFINKLIPSPSEPNTAPTPTPTSTPKSTPTPNPTLTPQSTPQNDTNNNENIDPAPIGKVAGLTSVKESTHSSNIEIRPIKSASQSFDLIATPSSETNEEYQSNSNSKIFMCLVEDLSHQALLRYYLRDTI